jgi:hypothetical protein
MFSFDITHLGHHYRILGLDLGGVGLLARLGRGQGRERAGNGVRLGKVALEELVAVLEEEAVGGLQARDDGLVDGGAGPWR